MDSCCCCPATSVFWRNWDSAAQGKHFEFTFDNSVSTAASHSVLGSQQWNSTQSSAVGAHLSQGSTCCAFWQFSVHYGGYYSISVSPHQSHLFPPLSSKRHFCPQNCKVFMRKISGSLASKYNSVFIRYRAGLRVLLHVGTNERAPWSHMIIRFIMYWSIKEGKHSQHGTGFFINKKDAKTSGQINKDSIICNC